MRVRERARKIPRPLASATDAIFVALLKQAKLPMPKTEHRFASPGRRFAAALDAQGDPEVLVAEHGGRIGLA